MSIAHSNAQCERIFSKMNLTKTKIRNRLIVPTVTGCILSSEYVKGTDPKQCCSNFKIEKGMLQRMSAANLYPKKQKQETELSDEEYGVLFSE